MSDMLPPVVDLAAAALRAELGDNLHSVCLYGSIARGNPIDGISDINLLIVLKESDPASHEKVAVAIGSESNIDPLVVPLDNFPRTVRAFAARFGSFKQHYRVIHGADPIRSIEIDSVLERLDCEHGLRDLREQLVHAFITRAQHKEYGTALAQAVTPIFVRASQVLRLTGKKLTGHFADRVEPLARELGLDSSTLIDLLIFKSEPSALTEEETVRWHERVSTVPNTLIQWVEKNWP